MKNNTLLITFISISLGLGLSIGCKKSEHPYNSLTPPDEGLIRDARDYFKKEWGDSLSGASGQSPAPGLNPVSVLSPRIGGSRSPVWEKAYTLDITGSKAVVVPVRYNHPFYFQTNHGGNKYYFINDCARLLIYKDSTRAYHAEMVTAIPDSSYKKAFGSPVTGLLLVDDWLGHPLRRYLYDGRSVRISTPELQTKSPGSPPNRVAITSTMLVCYEIYGYNYGAGSLDGGEAWSEPAGCSFVTTPETQRIDWTDYDRVGRGDGGGGGGSTIFTDKGNIIDGTNLTITFDSVPGIDLKKYFKCLDNIPNAGARYSVSICADLPVNSNPNALLNVKWLPGHSFIILTKTNGANGSSVAFGFYPEKALHSLSSIPVASQIIDDGSSRHEYDASLTMNNISALDFQTLEHSAENLAGAMKYDLDNYNCTNYALDVINTIRPFPIQVPDWIGYYSGTNFGKTPNGLYGALKDLQTNGGTLRNDQINMGTHKAPPGSGGCN